MHWIRQKQRIERGPSQRKKTAQGPTKMYQLLQPRNDTTIMKCLLGSQNYRHVSKWVTPKSLCPVSILLIFCLQNAPPTQLSVPSSSTSMSKHCKTMTPTAFPALSRIVPSDADLMLLTNKKVNSGIVHNIHPFSVPQLESRFSLRCQWHHAAVNG